MCPRMALSVHETSDYTGLRTREFVDERSTVMCVRKSMCVREYVCERVFVRESVRESVCVSMGV